MKCWRVCPLRRVDGPWEASAGNGRLLLLPRGQRVGQQTETCSKCIDYPRITMMGTCDWSAANGAACVTRHQLPRRLLWNEQHSYVHYVHWHALTCIDDTHLGRETSDEIAKGCQGLQSLAWCQTKRGNGKSWVIALLEHSYAGFVSPPKMADR